MTTGPLSETLCKLLDVANEVANDILNRFRSGDSIDVIASVTGCTCWAVEEVVRLELRDLHHAYRGGE